MTTATTTIAVITVAAAALAAVVHETQHALHVFVQDSTQCHGDSATRLPILAQHGLNVQHAAQHCCPGVAASPPVSGKKASLSSPGDAPLL